MATLAALRDKVRRKIGGPDTTDMPNATIEDYLTDDALTWLNHRDPNAIIVSFPTVANQQAYDVKPAAAYDVTDVWWDACNYINLGANLRFFPEGYEMNRQLAGFDAVGNPALVQIFYKQIEAYKDSFGGIGQEESDGLIWLYPTPGSTGENVWFRYTLARYAAVTAIADGSDHQEGLVKIAASMILGEPMFIKRGRIRSGRSFSGGGGANENILSGRLQDEAEGHVPEELVAQISQG